MRSQSPWWWYRGQSVDRNRDPGERLPDGELDAVGETSDQRLLPIVVGRLIVQVVLERQQLERQPERAELYQAAGRCGRGHVTGVQRQRQVQFPKPLASGKHIHHAVGRRLVAIGQVQTETVQLSHFTNPAQYVVGNVRTVGQAQRLQSGGIQET